MFSYSSHSVHNNSNDYFALFSRSGTNYRKNPINYLFYLESLLAGRNAESERENVNEMKKKKKRISNNM